ncbi:hypothetical protein GGU11DRAFT_584364 [Lentinula aff. detonsa]|nr:hypothetical protein GGU11DRAFT_584364 [Lentinula aff. detonsa]
MPGLGAYLLRLVHSIPCCSSFVHAQSGPSESSCSTLVPTFFMDVQLSISFHNAVHITHCPHRSPSKQFSFASSVVVLPFNNFFLPIILDQPLYIYSSILLSFSIHRKSTST